MKKLQIKASLIPKSYNSVSMSNSAFQSAYWLDCLKRTSRALERKTNGYWSLGFQRTGSNSMTLKERFLKTSSVRWNMLAYLYFGIDPKVEPCHFCGRSRKRHYERGQKIIFLESICGAFRRWFETFDGFFWEGESSNLQQIPIANIMQIVYRFLWEALWAE